MDLIIWGLIAIVGVVAALAAYGSWLIGQDSEAEAAARSMSSNGGVLSAGWSAIDLIRTAPMPVVTAIEDYIDHLREVKTNLLRSDPNEEDNGE